MISNNIFRSIAKFCTEVLFTPYDSLRSIDGWWSSNVVNAVFISIAIILLFYWLIQLQKFRKAAAN